MTASVLSTETIGSPDASLSGLRHADGAALGDPRICIAILDGPVDRSHPCLAGADLSEIDTLVDPGNDRGAALGHGTHVASVIFGQPGSAIAGVAPRCRGLILPVFASAPNGGMILCSQIDLARAIELAITHGAHVINVSGGQLTPDGDEAEPILARAIEACVDNNVLLVAAAGNDGCDCLHLPAAGRSVLSVGAMDGDGRPLDFSNFGAAYRDQGLLAPGRDIRGALPGGGVALKSGTSFATPIVSGLAALLLSDQLARGLPPDPAAVRAALLAGATPCDPSAGGDCRRFLKGAVNPGRALTLLVKGESTMSIVDTLPGTAATAIQPSDAVPADAPPRLSPSPAAAIVAAELAPQTAPEPKPAAPPLVMPSEIAPSDCGCGGGEKCSCGGGGGKGCSCGKSNGKGALVYALGKLWYDFGTEARRDRFMQFMEGAGGAAANPYDPAQMEAYLREHPYEAEALIWTLNLDATPIYAITAGGTFAHLVYDELRRCLSGQLHEGVEIVSIPGAIAGSVRLFSGQVVPLIVPSRRGIFSWATRPLIASVLGARPDAKAAQERYDRRLGGLNNFLSRVYYDQRNLGLTPQDRALNFAATNAFQVSQVMENATQGDYELDTISVRKSPVCRPDSDCYDVEVAFYNPQNVLVANRVYRFTVDVSDVIPVTIGEVRAWSKRA